jgi:hypothetical protein
VCLLVLRASLSTSPGQARERRLHRIQVSAGFYALLSVLVHRHPPFSSISARARAQTHMQMHTMHTCTCTCTCTCAKAKAKAKASGLYVLQVLSRPTAFGFARAMRVPSGRVSHLRVHVAKCRRQPPAASRQPKQRGL